MSYAKQIAEAVLDACEKEEGWIYGVRESLDAIIASVPKTEPFGYFRCDPALGWEDCAEDAEGAIALYEATHVSDPDEMAAIARERDRFVTIIRDFCDGQDWAAETWKAQDHIKPLFDAAKGVKP